MVLRRRPSRAPSRRRSRWPPRPRRARFDLRPPQRTHRTARPPVSRPPFRRPARWTRCRTRRLRRRQRIGICKLPNSAMNRAAVPLAPSQTSRRVGRWITICFLLSLAIVLMWRGFGYYRLSLSARPGHPDYNTLNPAGHLGHGYGIVGTILIFTNLLYLVRRRFAKYIPDRLGSMAGWLNAHAFTGLTGALLVAF